MFIQNYNGGEIHKNNHGMYFYLKDNKKSCFYPNISELVSGQIPEVTYGLSKTILKPVAKSPVKKLRKTTLKNIREIKDEPITTPTTN